MIGLIRLALIACIVWAGGVHAAGRVFYDGFEDGTTNAWSQDDTRDKCTVVSSALDGGAGPYSGTKMARCNWNGNVAWNANNSYETLVKGSWNYSSEFLIRFWTRVDADTDQTFGSKWFRLFSSGPTNSLIYDGQLEYSDAHGYFNLEWIDGNNPSGTTCYGGGALRPGWHKTEIYMKAATGGGGISRLWVDDVLKCEFTGFSSNPANKWYPLYIFSNWSSNPGWEHDSNNHVYWDEFEIYSDTGTGGSGSLSAGTMTQGGPVSADLAGSVSAISTETGQITTAIRPSGGSSALSTVSGTLNTPSSAQLQGAVSANSIVGGSAYIPLPAPATFERRAR